MQRTIDTEIGTNQRKRCSASVTRGLVHKRRALWRRCNLAARHLRAFLGAIHGADYLAAKAVDFQRFTCLALLVTAVFLAYTNVWDYAIDPINYKQAIGLRLFECGAALLWALASWRDVHAPTARAAAFIIPLAIEATFIQVLAILDQGSSYGMGGFLYFFIFVPFLVLVQPFVFAVAVLAAITVFPLVAAPLGLSADLDWGIYNAYMWMSLVPIVCILLLFEYLYWQVFRYRRQIEAQAVTDGLTRIPNRRHFLAETARSLELHWRNRRSASLLFVDIDRFKAINDAYGHRAGDGAIRHVVDTLLAPLRASDLIARYGGEEFVVLLPETGGSSAARIAERMRSAVAATPCSLAASGNCDVRLTVSIGVATYDPINDGRADIDVLLHRADQALYEAKHRGRDRIVRSGYGVAGIVES